MKYGGGSNRICVHMKEKSLLCVENVKRLIGRLSTGASMCARRDELQRRVGID